MYPVLRLGLEILISRRQPPLPVDGVHESRHTLMPWDMDVWGELNNGRTATLFDLNRTPLALRTGLVAACRTNRWTLTVAGASLRFRRRLTVFQRVTMRSRCVGRDDKFLYVHQTIWRGDVPATASLVRIAVADKAGIVATDALVAALGMDPGPPPSWVAAWIAAEAERPWPPDL